MRVEGLQNTNTQNNQNDLFQNLNYDQKREIRTLLDKLPQDKREETIKELKGLNTQKLDNQKYYNAIKESIQNKMAQSVAASFNNFSLYA